MFHLEKKNRILCYLDLKMLTLNFKKIMNDIFYPIKTSQLFISMMFSSTQKV